MCLEGSSQFMNVGHWSLFRLPSIVCCCCESSPVCTFSVVAAQWDIRSGEIVQEYDRHLGAVNTIVFVDENRRFVSTSDDKSLRVWEW